MTKTDKIIFWGTLLSALLFLLFSNVIFTENGEWSIVIELDGRQYARYAKGSLNKPKTLEIQTEFGYNKIEISNSDVRVSESDCMDRQCISEIHKIGDMIVCLPHRLVVKIEGNREVDGVAY